MTFPNSIHSCVHRRKNAFDCGRWIIDAKRVNAHACSDHLGRNLSIFGRLTLQTFTIVTTDGNELCGASHDRMPVILAREK